MSPVEQQIALIVEVVKNLTLVGALVWILIGGYRDWWRYGPACRRRDEEVRETFSALKADCTERIKQCELLAAANVEEWRQRLIASEKRSDDWQRMTLALLQTAERVVDNEEDNMKRN